MKTTLAKLIRCETLYALLLTVIIITTIKILLPLSITLYHKGNQLYGFWALKERTAAVMTQKSTILHELRLLDSLSIIYEQRLQMDDGGAAAMLYRRADSIGIKTPKVFIGEKLSVDNHRETAVTIRGTGTYSSIGRFCETIENLPSPVTIRNISAASGLTPGTIDATIDFVLLSQEHEKDN